MPGTDRILAGVDVAPVGVELLGASGSGLRRSRAVRRIIRPFRERSFEDCRRCDPKPLACPGMPASKAAAARRRPASRRSPRPTGRPGPRAAGAGRAGRPAGDQHLRHARPPPRPVPASGCRSAASCWRGKLPARDRELLILRTGWNCRVALRVGASTCASPAAAGVTEDEVERRAGRPRRRRVGAGRRPRCCGRPTSCTTTPASPTPPGRRSPSATTSASSSSCPCSSATTTSSRSP